MPSHHIFEHCPLDQHFIQLGQAHGRLKYLTVLESTRRNRRTPLPVPKSSPSPISEAVRSEEIQSQAINKPSESQRPKERQSTCTTSSQTEHLSWIFTQSLTRSTPLTTSSLIHCATTASEHTLEPTSSSAPPLTSLNQPQLSHMLNVRALSEMLKANEDEALWPKIFLMSPNGTLVAYSQPSNTKELRDQAALISMAWKEQDAAKSNRRGELETTSSHSSNVVSVGNLETLTIEKDNMNLIVQALQPNLLIVMHGGAPPGRKKELKMTPELRGDPRYPSGEPVLNANRSAKASPSGSLSKLSTSQSSTVSQRDRDIQGGALHLQRKKLDALVREIRKDFDAKGFVMPDDVAFR